MSKHKEIPQANQTGFPLSGVLKNSAWVGLSDLSGWTAKVSLLTLPALTAAAECTRQNATIDYASFDPDKGEVHVTFPLSSLDTPVPLGTYRVRWIIITPDNKELGGPPSTEATVYAFTP